MRLLLFDVFIWHITACKWQMHLYCLLLTYVILDSFASTFLLLITSLLLTCELDNKLIIHFFNMTNVFAANCPLQDTRSYLKTVYVRKA